jgi:hypothetical protein
MPAFHWLCFSPWAFQPSIWFVPCLTKGAVRKVKSLASCYDLLNFQQAKLHKKQNICKIFETNSFDFLEIKGICFKINLKRVEKGKYWPSFKIKI